MGNHVDPDPQDCPQTPQRVIGRGELREGLYFSISANILRMFHPNVSAQLYSTRQEGRTDITRKADVQMSSFNMFQHVFA
jgi:hypothetical protein